MLTLDTIPRYSGARAKVMSWLGLVDRLDDGTAVRKQDLVTALAGDALSKAGRRRVHHRILQIGSTQTQKPLKVKQLEKLFNSFGKPKSEKEALEKLEDLRHELSSETLTYKESFSEVVGFLEPGDILVHKYHEDARNIICKGQKLFAQAGYRDAPDCSHIALYLGEINGHYWVAEAVVPGGSSPQVRRVRVDDPRFELKGKNEYIVIRKEDQEEARQAAKLAVDYTIKAWKEDVDKEPPKKAEGLNYSFFEAARSLWHSPRLDYFARQRMMKYYADSQNGLPFEYLGKDRGFFCSHFALSMETLAEMKNSEKFTSFMKRHSIPKKPDQKKGGLARKVSDLWYSVRKGVWARQMALLHPIEINQSVSTKLDFLRSTPQDTVLYMTSHPDQYKVKHIISRSKS